MKRTIPIFLILCFPLVAAAAMIYVPGDQPTIQAGIDAAVDGDIVLVSDGTYTGSGNRDIGFRGKAITVRAESGSENCIIDCEEQGRGFHFTNGEEQDSVLDGFTIRNGEAWGGGGILCDGSSPTITNCTFSDNTAEEYGGGIFCAFSSPTITNCTFSGNVAHYGGGIFCVHSSPTITNCTFSANHALDWYYGYELSGDGGGVCCIDASSPTITNCTFSANVAHGGLYGYSRGGGIACWQSTTITNCTFSGNVANDGGGISCGDSTTITNCTFSGNVAGDGGGIACWGSTTITNCIVWNNSPDSIHDASGSSIVSYSDVQGGWPGEGNIDADPLFFAGPEGNYYFSQVAAGQAEDSPCLDAGSEPSADICFDSGEGTVCLDQRPTRTDFVDDAGQVDMGYHYPGRMVESVLTSSLTFGTVPFTTDLSVTVSNRHPSQSRTLAGRIDVELAGGQSLPNWRTGFLSVPPGDSFTTSWPRNIPALGSVIGRNEFTLVAEDVTPAPFNQPPYPPSGDTDTDSCTVTGIAP